MARRACGQQRVWIGLSAKCGTRCLVSLCSKGKMATYFLTAAGSEALAEDEGESVDPRLDQTRKKEAGEDRQGGATISVAIGPV